MKNPMTPTEMKQALDDNAAECDMQFRPLESGAEWEDCHANWAGEPLDFSTLEYRRKPELLTKYTLVIDKRVCHTFDTYEDAAIYKEYYGECTMHKMVEDLDWVGPEPEDNKIPRCLITGNPCGTDTHPVGYTCQCANCIKTNPDPNPWRKIVHSEWPECKPRETVEVRTNGGVIMTQKAGEINWGSLDNIEWRYAEDDE